MVKKLLLFAILSPLAMQPIMKADGVQPGVFKRALTKVTGACFNDTTELVTTGLFFGSLVYKALGAPLKNHREFNTFVLDNKGTKTLSYFLTLFELGKTILTFPEKNRDSVKATFGFLKLLSLITLRVAPDATTNLSKKHNLYWKW